MPDRDLELIQGTLNVLILRTLSWGAMNGYAIGRWIRETTGGELDIDEGAHYPALHRMEHRGWISAEWGVSENNRRAKYYSLTPAGRRALRARMDGWERLVAAVGKVLHPATRPT